MRGWPLAGLLFLGACGPEPVPDRVDCDAPGAVCTVVGTGEHGYNGAGNPPLQTHLYYPSAVYFFDDGAPLIVDFNNMRLITVVDDAVQTLAGFGFHGGASDGIDALESPLENPIDASPLADGGFLIVEHHTGRVLRVDATGWLTVIAGTGNIGFAGDGGPAKDAVFSEIAGITVAPDGLIYVADTDNHCVRVLAPATGLVERVAGDGNPGAENGSVAEARFAEPWHLQWHDDALYVADRGNHQVRRIDLQTGAVTRLAGTGTPGHSGDGGSALEAQLNMPSGLDVADDGTVWVADRMNHVIRRIDPDGTIHTAVGVPEGAGDGPDRGTVDEAILSAPDNVTIEPETGRLWIADTHNSKVRVYVP